MVAGQAFTDGEFGYGNLHQIDTCHLVDDTQFTGCCPVAGIEILIAGTVEVDTFAQCFKNGEEVDFMIFAGKAVRFGQVVRLVLRQRNQMSF